MQKQAARQHLIIDRCLFFFEKSLVRSFDESIKKTLNVLFSKSEKAQSNSEEVKIFEQFNLLKKSSAWTKDPLLSIIDSMPDEIYKQVRNNEEEIKLSLVNDEDLEITLAFTQLESVLDIKFTKYLYALEKRFKVIYASRKIDKFNMPFGASSVVWVYSQLFDLLEVSIKTKTLMIRELTRLLIINLEGMYLQINQEFEQAGILPNIKFEYKNLISQKPSNKSTAQRAAEQKNTENPDSKVESSKQNDVSGAKVHSENHTVNEIFNFLSNRREQQIPVENINAPVNVDADTLDKVLSQMPKNRGIGRQFKENLLDTIKNTTGVFYPKLSPQHQNAMEVMGLFYEHVQNDSNIDQNVISSIDAISIPLLRLATANMKFFEDDKHPAREYLENIIQASQKWHGTKVVDDLQKFSKHVAGNFDGSDTAFKTANEDLTAYLEMTELRAQRAEQKWVSVSKGKEKMERARMRVNQIIDELINLSIPHFIKQLLLTAFKDKLILVLLREGEESSEWRKIVSTATCIAQMTHAEMVRKLTPKQKIESLHHTDLIMNELGYSVNDKTNVLLNIKECSLAVMDGKDEKEIQIIDVPSIKEKIPLSENKISAQKTKKDEYENLTEEEKSQLTRFKLLPFGTFFDFNGDENSSEIRRKLSWFSPVSNNALFVSLVGNKPHEQSLSSVARDMVAKKLRIVEVEKKEYFKGVLSSIYNKIRNIMGTRQTA